MAKKYSAQAKGKDMGKHMMPGGMMMKDKEMKKMMKTKGMKAK